MGAFSVCVNNCFSSFLPVHSGVPQGGILGPLLFVVFIDESIKVSKLYVSCGGMYLYADNAKLFSNNVNDLQSSLSRIVIWLRELQLLLAPSICEHLCISRSFIFPTHNFCIDSYNIRSFTAVKDLDVYISRNLKWSHHIQHIYSTANVCAYQIMRIPQLMFVSTKYVWTLLKVFITYVRPKLKYNSPVWNLYFKKDVHLLESIQKKNLVMMCLFVVIYPSLLMLIVSISLVLNLWNIVD